MSRERNLYLTIGDEHIKVKRLHTFPKKKREKANDQHKFGYDYRCFQLAYLKYRTHVKEVLAFILVRYTITDHQKTETL